METWEYLVKENLDESDLDNVGEDGWELVAVTCNGNGTPEVFYFKRPKE
jgi:hypothetical protein